MKSEIESKSENKQDKDKKPQPLYKQIKLLGQGSYGKAYLVENTKLKVRIFIIKDTCSYQNYVIRKYV